MPDMTVTAWALLRAARDRHWTFRVYSREPPVITASPGVAWTAVTGVTEAKVEFYEAGSKLLGWAYLMVPGKHTCSDDESLVDYSDLGNELTDLCNELTANVN